MKQPNVTEGSDEYKKPRENFHNPVRCYKEDPISEATTRDALLINPLLRKELFDNTDNS
jgi:hypothetical protein